MTQKLHSKELYAELESKIEANIRNMQVVSLMAADFHAYKTNQSGLDKNLSDIVKNFVGIEDLINTHMKDKNNPNPVPNHHLIKDYSNMNLLDIYIPLEILNYIDKGQSPELFTKSVVQRSVDRNEHVNGQIKTLTKFRERLLGFLR